MPFPSVGEMLIVLGVVILLVRPEDLPKFCRTVGRFYGEIRRYLTMGMSTLEKISRLDQMPPYSPPPPDTSARHVGFGSVDYTNPPDVSATNEPVPREPRGGTSAGADAQVGEDSSVN